MDTTLIILSQAPTFIAVIAMIIRYEHRLTKIETKIDILLPYKREAK